MFVIIARCIALDDTVTLTLAELRARFDPDYPLAAEATAPGDVRALTRSAGAALETALHLLRVPHWRVGLGVGDVRSPLPTSIRDATGDGVTAAWSALTAAEHRESRVAVRERRGSPTSAVTAETLDPLFDLLLAHRARWSEHSWELHDLLEGGGTQAHAAELLGITPQAVSKRARAAGLRVDAEARTALARLLSVVE